MKASKFFVVFEKEITTWERTLSVVSEMLEMVLQVWQVSFCQILCAVPLPCHLDTMSLLFEVGKHPGAISLAHVHAMCSVDTS
jgi:hypothetical protein